MMISFTRELNFRQIGKKIDLISIEEYTFARTVDGGQLMPVGDPAVSKRGDAVHLVLEKTGPSHTGLLAIL